MIYYYKGVIVVGLLFSLIYLIPILIGFGILVLYVFLIIKIIQNPSINDHSKIFWVILLLVGNIVGLIVYLVVEDKNILTNNK